jgi:hypothetical protein
MNIPPKMLDLKERILNHPNDEDLLFHPSEQKSLAGEPESLGTPKRQKQSRR